MRSLHCGVGVCRPKVTKHNLDDLRSQDRSGQLSNSNSGGNGRGESETGTELAREFQAYKTLH